MPDPEPAKKTRRSQRKTHVFVDADQQVLGLGTVAKVYRDLLKHHLGIIPAGPDSGPYTVVDLDRPAGSVALQPSETNPVCLKCDLWTHRCGNPFLPYYGSTTPLVTFVFDSVSWAEDAHGYVTASGAAKELKELVDSLSAKTGITSDDCRFVPLTRCAHRMKQAVNYKSKGEHCKIFAVQDLHAHPPRVVIPVGTVALGLLCHKSNAQDWGGRRLTWRGWPDNWLTDRDYVKPRTVTVGGVEQQVTGHPILGAPPGPDSHCLLYPIQSPRLVWMMQNARVTRRWAGQLEQGLKLAVAGAVPLTYNLPHYRLLYTKEEVSAELHKISSRPGLRVCYDTETTGLLPFMGDRIVFMMFRYQDPDTGNPVAIGFPWDYAEDPLRGAASPLLPHLAELRPQVLAALAASELVGHNLTFDILFSYCALGEMGDFTALDARGNMRPEWRVAMQRLDALAGAARYDTWHMAYTRRQQRGSLGLEILAYDHVPELAGYEEELTLLIERERELLHPEEGGHYARCPVALWESHFKPYVLGDVEVCYRAQQSLEKKLATAIEYQIPVAHTTKRGLFRYAATPGRAWLYNRVMAPASQVLIKMMGRGMFIDSGALAELENSMPKAIKATVAEMRGAEGSQIRAWCAEQEALNRDPADPQAVSTWELDLDKKDQMRAVLFDLLQLPVTRMTKTGRLLYGEEAAEWPDRLATAMQAANPGLSPEELAVACRKELLKYAALDKFVLNQMAVKHPEVRPLQAYRKAHKLYSTYVRPLRNIFSEGVDKKERTKPRQLCPDGAIHAQFLLTGTRGGRLSSRCLPKATLIATQRGIIPLSCIVPGDSVQTPSGPRRVLASVDSGLKDTLQFTLEYGRQLECSPDHLILCNGIWKTAGQVAVGDSFYLCGVPGPEVPPVALPLPEYVGNRGSAQQDFPCVLDADLAFLLGHYIAEGCLGYNKVSESVNRGKGANQYRTYAAGRVYAREHATGSRVPYKIIHAFGWREKGLKDKIKKLYKRLFGLQGVYTERGSPALTFASRSVAEYLILLGCGGYSAEKRVPPSVFLSPLAVRLAFLQALFEGDGGAQRGTAKLSTDSVQLAADVVELLSSVGILAAVGNATRADGSLRWHVSVLADSRDRAAELFWSARKKGKIRLVTPKGTSGACLPGHLPFYHAELVAAGCAYHSAWGVRTRQQQRYSRALLLKLRGKCSDPQTASYLAFVADSRAHSVEVVSKQQGAAQLMWDITVEGDCFLVNGLCVHNSPNLQNLPKEGIKSGIYEYNVKEMYVSRFGARGCLYGADFSQIELRLLASVSGDASMVDAYARGLDLHTLTASRLFKLSYDTFSKDHMQWLEANGRIKEAKDLRLKRDVGKCVDPHTLISVNGRITRIGGLHSGREPDTFYPMAGTIQGPHGEVPVKNFYSNGVKDQLLVCSRRGLVVCSTEHPFLLKSGVLKRAKDLAPGDALADPVALKGQDNPATRIDFCPFGTKFIDSHFQIQVGADLAYLLGMFYGDGCSNIGEVSICTGGTPEFFEWQDIVARSVEKAGFRPKIIRTEWSSVRDGPKVIKSGPTAGQVVNGAYGMVNFGCTRVSDIFIQLGAVEHSAKRRRTLKIPEWLFNASRELKLSFLAGWLDTDGSCARQGSLSGVTKSWTLAQDLMVLLDSCGIYYAFEPSWNKTYNRYYYRINLSVESSWTHFRHWLRHPKKLKGLRKPCFVYKVKRPNAVTRVIPLPPGPLVDVEVGAEDHLFICNSSTCRNTANFLTGYGGGAYGLQTVLSGREIYWEIEECERLIQLFFDSYPAVRDLLGYYKRFIQDNSVAVSLFGRVRIFEEVQSSDPEISSKALRAGCNHLIQSTASDMMLVCLAIIEELMRQDQLDSILVSTVHDSLLIDAIRDELPRVHEIVSTVLNNMPEFFKAFLGADFDTRWMVTEFTGDSDVGLAYNSMRSVPADGSLDWDRLLAKTR